MGLMAMALQTPPFLRPSDGAAALVGAFSGSTPCDASIRPLLGIPADTAADLMEWTLALHRDPATKAPSNYHLRVRYGVPIQGTPGLRGETKTLERRGSWRVGRGAKGRPHASVYELAGIGSLLEVTPAVVHLLNRDGTLMVGNGGWSYTLNREDEAETHVDLSATTAPEISYTLAPLASGPSVFGVFEGRTPCQRIASALKIAVDSRCGKVKWRVTLYQDPRTREPTTYRVEGSLHRSAREGRWTVVRGGGAPPDRVVYRLEPTRTEAALFLLRGDDNVLFFMDGRPEPLTAHAEFSYTLNRREEPETGAARR
jgi:hypothetical protein